MLFNNQKFIHPSEVLCWNHRPPATDLLYAFSLLILTRPGLMKPSNIQVSSSQFPYSKYVLLKKQADAVGSMVHPLCQLGLTNCISYTDCMEVNVPGNVRRIV